MLDAVLYKQFLLSYISAKPHACQRGYNVYPPSSLIQDLERGSGGDAKLRKCALRPRPTDPLSRFFGGYAAYKVGLSRKLYYHVY